MARFCTNCGKEVPEGNNACSNCGTMLNGAAPTPAAQPTVVVNSQPAQGNGMATAGFVVSLVSSLLCCGSFNLISLILSIVGLVKSKDVGGKGKGLAIAGIIISALGLILLIILTIFGYAAAIVEEASSYGY